MQCTECGATLPESGDCLVLLHEMLALEAQVAGAPGVVPHFLAVATYNLQHPSTFAPAALTGLRRAVADVLDGRATIADVRRRAAAWPTHWPTTVLDICRLAPELYVEHVTRWARNTIRTLNEALGAPPGASE
jgi:uncharacterized protein DUF5946